MRKTGLLIVGALTSHRASRQEQRRLSRQATTGNQPARAPSHQAPTRSSWCPPALPATEPDAAINVHSGVRVHRGCNIHCPGSEESSDTGKIRGVDAAHDPASLQVHFARVQGRRQNAGRQRVFLDRRGQRHPRVAPTINGYSDYRLGFIRNTVRGTVRLSNDHMDDLDANEYVTNRIKGSLICHNNTPARLTWATPRANQTS